MSAAPQTPERRNASPQRPERWGAATVVAHWLSAAVVLATLGVGLAMIHGGFDAATTFDLFQRHKSLGVVVAALTVVRLVARAVGSSPAMVGSRFEQGAARAVHVALYALLVIAVGSGWLVVSTAPLPIPTRVFGLFTLPPIARADPALFALATRVHLVATWTIGALTLLHVAAAVKHALVDRVPLFRRMWF